jgi:hypothetical protein
MQVRTLAGGVVIKVGNTNPEGYGNVVAVRTPSGQVEHYAHLADGTFRVRVGQVVQPGTALAVMGNTGGSTGPHVDVSIWKSEELLYQSPQTNTVDPMAYMRTIRHNYQAAPLGVGPSPTSASQISSFDDISRIYNDLGRYQQGRTVAGGVSSNPGRVATNSTPLVNGRAASNRNAYPLGMRNNPEHNFGYTIIAEDREYRIALAEYAARLNIPTQWLADVIDYETAGTHNPRIPNNQGCLGLIQFCPTGGLHDVARFMGVNISTARERLRNMGRTEQLRYVYHYLQLHSEQGALLNTIEDLYTVIIGGPGALRASGGNRLNRRDSNGSIREHLTRLGNRAGRRYQLSFERSSATHTHTSFQINCPECERQQIALGRVVPHEARA